MNKHFLRQEIKKKKELISQKYKTESSEKIADTVIHSQGFLQAQSIFVYISSPHEPDTKAIIKTALTLGKTVYVPKCISRGYMIPVQIYENTTFTSGYMGITEPAEYNENISPAQIDLSVIPCVSASPACDRLGHGAGFYDIFLEKIKTEKICLCFHTLLSDFIPTDENDIKMDMVITENQVYSRH